MLSMLVSDDCSLKSIKDSSMMKNLLGYSSISDAIYVDEVESPEGLFGLTKTTTLEETNDGRV